MKPELAEKRNCTGCGACIARCPKKCISYEADKTDNVYPVVNYESCIECGSCMSVCPAVKKAEKYEPLKAYACWHTDTESRRNSASGGGAAALYDYAQRMGYVCYGVEFDNEFNLNFAAASVNEKASDKFRNSKYVFSNISVVLAEIEKSLKSGEKVFIVGVPCQIAGLKSFLKKDYDNLVTADLICHGMCSEEYLKQHISHINKVTGKKADKILFRDPDMDTENCCFSALNKEERFYSKSINADDVYQIGYHSAITYRENCYSCRYASVERVGDIMLADYWLLGKFIPFEYDRHHVSLTYVNSGKGRQFFDGAVAAGLLFAVERPISEAARVQGQLNRPSLVTTEHKRFVKEYIKDRDFERAAKKAMYKELLCNKHGLRKYLGLYKRLRRKIFDKRTEDAV